MLDAEPPRDDAVALVVRAWADLSTCRPVGMAPGPIPWTAIVEWCRWHGLDREAAEILSSVIRRLDADELERHASKERTA